MRVSENNRNKIQTPSGSISSWKGLTDAFTGKYRKLLLCLLATFAMNQTDRKLKQARGQDRWCAMVAGTKAKANCALES